MLQDETTARRVPPHPAKTRPRMSGRKLLIWVLLFVVLLAALTGVIVLAHTSGSFPHR